jgi:pantoate--beta-alanine ligase
MAIVYLGLGSNLGDREANLKKALDHLREHGVQVLRVSRLVETEPEGGPSQPDFLNGAARVRTDLTPEELLDVLQAAETAAGRQKTGVRWGPREADLDILLYDDRIVRTPRLTVPHPLMLEREFVLAPLAEIAPDAVHPERERTVRQLFTALDDRKCGRHRVRLARSLTELHDYVGMAKRNRFTIGLVPTMGAFHEGHLSLMRAARRECDLVIVSLFVNPAQFGPDEDLSSYPRRLDADLSKAAAENVDLVFAPEADAIYPAGAPTFVNVEELTDRWCGESRPGHFRGVTTVVAKLFHLVRPDVAFFGRKDYQQSVVIRRMVDDLFFPVEVRVLPTARESDGLAMSSRNAYLTAADRERATCLWRGMSAAREAFDAGERTVETLVAKVRDVLEATDGVEPEYVAIVDPDSLSPLTTVEERAVILLAVRLGGTRLIDNLVLGEE